MKPTFRKTLKPHVIAAEIAEDLEAAVEQFTLIAADLGARATKP